MENEIFNEGIVLEYIKHSEQAIQPSFATPESACFDIRASLRSDDLKRSVFHIAAYTNENKETTISYVAGDYFIEIPPGWRAKVPTNIEFVIPTGYKILLYARSGYALKHGLVLANSVGVIDCDYHFPTFVLMHNTSDVPVTIFDNERIAQGELVPSGFVSSLEEVSFRTKTETERTGGFGSTGS